MVDLSFNTYRHPLPNVGGYIPDKPHVRQICVGHTQYHKGKIGLGEYSPKATPEVNTVQYIVLSRKHVYEL